MQVRTNLLYRRSGFSSLDSFAVVYLLHNLLTGLYTVESQWCIRRLKHCTPTMASTSQVQLLTMFAVLTLFHEFLQEEQRIPKQNRLCFWQQSQEGAMHMPF
jgi:hypothetical protein